MSTPAALSTSGTKFGISSSLRANDTAPFSGGGGGGGGGGAAACVSAINAATTFANPPGFWCWTLWFATSHLLSSAATTT